MYNVFEDILPRNVHDVADIKYALLNNGALSAVMTGTGSAVFGIYNNKTHAKKAFECLKLNYNECYLCEPIKNIPL